MHASATYEAILREGREEGRAEGREEGRAEGRITEARRLLVRQGTKRFAKPHAEILTAIEAIADIDRLETLFERITDPDVRDWQSLLGPL
jgi:predicted transposase YdaD